MAEPSTQWREVSEPGEHERHQRQAAQFAELQLRKSEKYGVGRGLHRKQRLALRASLTTLPDLPEPARHGIFATPTSYETWLRLSNGGFDRAPDSVPDIRGFAIKVLGVTGEAVLGGAAVSQDFALINHEHFSSPTSEDFTKVVTIGGRTPAKALLSLIRNPGVLPQLKAVSQAIKSPFTGFATQDFFSAAPLACGPYAIRVRLRAASDHPRPNSSDDWSVDIYDRLATAPLVYDFQIQFFLDEQSTPIEDASVTWPSPYLTVARLTIPQQQRDPDFDEQVEAARFDPWNAVVDHRPLGEVMRARKVAYYSSQQNRSAR